MSFGKGDDKLTVSTTNSTQTFSGGQSVLTFNFSALTAFPQYIQVSAIALTGGTVTALSYGTQYTVTISTTGVGGTVIITPTYGTNYNYVVYRQTAILQSSNYTNYNAFPATTLMSNLDQLTMIDQEANTNVSLTLAYPIGTATTYSTTMPIPSIGTVLGTDPTGTKFVNLPPAPSGATGATGPSGSTGSVSSVSSSTSDITVVSTSTTPIITAVNAATSGANTILRLSSSGGLPTNLVESIIAYGSSLTSGSTIVFSNLKVYYGVTGSVTSAGTLVTNLGFSSSTSYIVNVAQSGTAVNANSSFPAVTINSGSQFTVYSTASSSTYSSIYWVAMGV